MTAGGVPLDDADRAILALEGPTVVGHTCKVVLVGRVFRVPVVAAAAYWREVGHQDRQCCPIQRRPSGDLTLTVYRGPTG